jgi:hypothetical protein
LFDLSFFTMREVSDITKKIQRLSDDFSSFLPNSFRKLAIAPCGSISFKKSLWRSTRSGLSGEHRATRAADAQKRPLSQARPKTKKRNETTKKGERAPAWRRPLTLVSCHFPSCEREGELSRLTGCRRDLACKSRRMAAEDKQRRRSPPTTSNRKMR